MIQVKRKYISIDEIQREYISLSKKRIRALVKKHLQVKMIGGRLYTEREALDRLLADPGTEYLPLD